MDDVERGANLSESELVDRARRGDSRAFGVIYQRHVDRVYSFIVFRVRDVEIAQDLTHDVFVQALRGLPAYSWRGSIAPWLLRIAHNSVVDHWRRVARRPEAPAGRPDSDAQRDRPDRLERSASSEAAAALEAVEVEIDRVRLLDAAEGLSDLQRQVIALRFAAGLSIRETAEVLGRSEGAVKNLQHHAVRALRRSLGTGEV
jgi:RNA polymerase sigma-70 factor (ECF subfamily)